MPGVRSGTHNYTWPRIDGSRNTVIGNNGGEYVAARRALLRRYVAPWLCALHDQESSHYGDMIYELCVELAAVEGSFGYLRTEDESDTVSRV